MGISFYEMKSRHKSSSKRALNVVYLIAGSDVLLRSAHVDSIRNIWRLLFDGDEEV